jgi:propionyl-CoA carboxylase alpha chain
MYFNFQFRGHDIKTKVFDPRQYKYKHFMAEPVKLDTAKMVLSPMPGAIVSMNVEQGQTVVDGQILCVIEAMKMQNLIKSQREGKIKSINVKTGDSVHVDQILIEYE